MRKKIKLVVSDLDGTLLDSYNRISPENKAAVFALREQGIRFTVATGRLDCMARIYFEELEIDEPVISCNGALIRTGLSHEIVHLQRMRPEMAEKIIRFSDELGLDYLVYDTDVVYYPPNSYRIQAYRDYNALARRYNSQECVTERFTIEADVAQVAHCACKIYLHSPQVEKIARTREFIARETDLIAVSSMDDNLDVAPPGQTKGGAVAWLADYYGITADEICVFGDNDNDVSMFEHAGLSFAMRDGTPLAHASASHIAESNDCSGVGRAIRQYILP